MKININPLPLLLSLGEGLSAIHSCRTALAPRGDQAAAAADWASGPAAQPIRCLGSETIQESAARRGAGAGAGSARMWRIPVVPQSATWPSGLGLEQGESLAGETPARGCRTCRAFWKSSRAVPGCRAVCFKGCGHEVIFLLIGVMCFQFPSSH